MKYVSIDLETTGLDPKTCHILEIGMVIEDTGIVSSVYDLPHFHTYVTRDCPIVGEAYALAMHREILSRIAERPPEYTYTPARNLVGAMTAFLAVNGLRPPYNVAGKNFATFDLLFLRALPNWDLKFHRRVIDPSILFFDPFVDTVLPDTQLCMKRAGIDGESKHTAIEDAEIVVNLLRRGLNGRLSN